MGININRVKLKLGTIRTFREEIMPYYNISEIEFTQEENKKLILLDHTDFISIAECFIICKNKLKKLKVNDKLSNVFINKDIAVKNTNFNDYFELFSDLDVLNKLLFEWKNSIFKKHILEREIKNLIEPYLNEMIYLINLCYGEEEEE